MAWWWFDQGIEPTMHERGDPREYICTSSLDEAREKFRPNERDEALLEYLAVGGHLSDTEIAAIERAAQRRLTPSGTRTVLVGSSRLNGGPRSCGEHQLREPMTSTRRSRGRFPRRSPLRQ